MLEKLLGGIKVNGEYSNKSVVLDEEFLPKTLLDFLDDISPGLFLGKIKPENLMLEHDAFLES